MEVNEQLKPDEEARKDSTLVTSTLYLLVFILTMYLVLPNPTCGVL